MNMVTVAVHVACGEHIIMISNSQRGNPEYSGFFLLGCCSFTTSAARSATPSCLRCGQLGGPPKHIARGVTAVLPSRQATGSAVGFGL